MATWGTTGADTITGTSGNDVFDGKGGNDTEIGGGGDDTYIFRQGYGQLTIDNASSSSTVPAGQLLLGLGLTGQKLWFMQSGDNLTMDVLGSTDHVTVNDWFGSNQSAELASIVASDGLHLDTGLSQLISTMAAYSSSNPGFNPVTAAVMPTDPTLVAALTAAWHP